MIQLSTLTNFAGSPIRFTQSGTEKRGAGYYEDRDRAREEARKSKNLQNLGDLRAEQITAETSEKVAKAKERLLELEQEQQKALSMMDSEAYDALVEERKQLESIIKSEPQGAILSAEAKADPFGTHQLSRDRLEAQNREKQALSDPRVLELIAVQKDASLQGQRLASDYVTAKSEEERKAIAEQYFELQKASDKAGSELGANPNLKGYHMTPMANLYDLAKKAGAGMSAGELVELEKGIKGKQLEKLKIEAEDIESRIALNKQMQSEQIAKLKEQRGYDAHDRITKALKDRSLTEPAVYDRMIAEATIAKDAKNLFMMVKLLSQVIEPGLSVTEGEAGGYTIGGQGVIAKQLMNTFGAKTTDLQGVLNLLTSVAKTRKTQAEEVIREKGLRKTSDEPTKRKKIQRNW